MPQTKNYPHSDQYTGSQTYTQSSKCPHEYEYVHYPYTGSFDSYKGELRIGPEMSECKSNMFILMTGLAIMIILFGLLLIITVILTRNIRRKMLRTR